MRRAPYSTPRDQRSSSYLLTATLRLRHSWTLWLRSRAEKRLVREKVRLARVDLLRTDLERRVLALEGRLHPPPVTVRELEPAPVQGQELEPAYPPPATIQPPPVPPQQQELDEPMPDPVREIALRLGLQPPPI